MVSLFGLEILIVYNAVTASNVVGTLIALIVSANFLDRAKGMVTILAVSLLISIALQGLVPFDPRPVIDAFNWLPFHSFFGENMYQNTLVLLQKLLTHCLLYCSLSGWQNLIAWHLSHVK